jgi:hypothetical protein
MTKGDILARYKPFQPMAVQTIVLRAFPGKVDTGFPIGNATNIESRALSGHDPCNFRVNLIGKRSNRQFVLNP